MCQPRRKSPAQRQVEALAEVERIAQALYELIWAPSRWAALSEEHRQVWRGYVRELLQAGVIRPGIAPPELDAPIPGQTTIEEQLNA